MKYGLLTYQYRRREDYNVHNVNIGDYIQSIAARQFLPQVDAFIDRDQVASHSGEPIKLIMNGWWHIAEGNEVTSDAIIPLYVAYHLDNPECLTNKALEHLKRFSPIGCRDFHTLNCLHDKGIDTYSSACLTLTLGKTYYVPEEERSNTVFFVDCDFLDAKNPSWLQWCLSRRARRSCSLPVRTLKRQTLELLENILHDSLIEKRSHAYPMSLDDRERFQVADQLLRDYSQAKLIVTSRLHCALPAISMGVPVLFIANNVEDCRYAGLLDNVNLIGLDRQRNLVEHLVQDSDSLLRSSLLEQWRNVCSEALSTRCEQFIAM